MFGAMGINWVMEILSFYVGGPNYLWYATDALNCLQGVWTFVIFVLNRPARQEIRARIRELRERRAGRDEYRVPEHPQIDDFQTVVNRQSRLVTHLSPWQQEVRGLLPQHPDGGGSAYAAPDQSRFSADDSDDSGSVTEPLRTSTVP
ncbi:uncharacterized protein LOC127748850 [Frankliniella occidentalis]|uniref:Uncharacterized protein LOC127748850 n=1 Tax=Frankliniella occidentalis TaxID=133901 RepID=A0A9C6WVT4_FRAOC|nr:uncharacterized protein LOC127748850 [Frankliniella occidentalis]